MAFRKKTWADRSTENPGRRKLTIQSTSGSEQIVDVVRYEGQTFADGDAFSAQNMNDLEDRIDQGFGDIPVQPIDNAISDTSTNPVQNRVIYNALTGKANSAHTHGNIQNNGALQNSDITIASGDKLVVTDNDNGGRVGRTSVTFDGSTANQFLSRKGTWESVLSFAVLWTNPSDTYTSGTPVSSAAGSPYSAIYVEGYNSTASGYNRSIRIYVLVPKGFKLKLAGVADGRDIEFRADGSVVISAADGGSNTVSVPIRIFGIK